MAVLLTISKDGGVIAYGHDHPHMVRSCVELIVVVFRISLRVVDSYYHLVSNYFNPISLGDVTW